jgi:1,4-dihydroxy-2-naphthoate polyprenyltransferase
LKTIQNWLQAFRLKTLTAAVVPIATAAALAHLNQKIIPWPFVALLLAAALSIQIATNLFNDAIDFKKGADRYRTGPMRVTQAGIFSERSVYFMAFAFCFLALACGVPLVLRGGWPLVVIGLSSLFLAYGYTGGPYPLAYKGLGELFVILYFGLIAVMGSYYILTLEWSLAAAILGLQVGFLSTILIAINNLRDRTEDAKVGKKTLAARWGESFAIGEIIFLSVASYGLMIFWFAQYQKIYFALYFLTLPLSFKIISRVRANADKARLIPALGMSALLHILFGVCFCVASAL